MLGKSHMTIGALGFVAAANPLLHTLGQQLTPAELACGTAVAAGAAMLPDLDHPQATVSRSLGPVSYLLSRGVARAAGGHRQGTHSLLAVGLVGLGTSALLAASSSLLVPWLLTFVCVSLVCRILLEQANDLTSAVVAALAAVGLLAITPNFDWLPVAITFGYALHLAADAVTQEGVPLGWPLVPIRFSLGLLTTGGGIERAVCWCALALLGLGSWQSVLYPAILQTHRSETQLAARQLHSQASRAHASAAERAARPSLEALQRRQRELQRRQQELQRRQQALRNRCGGGDQAACRALPRSEARIAALRRERADLGG